MSFTPLSPLGRTLIQSQRFSFSKENLDKIHRLFTKYPKGEERSALLEILQLAQEQNEGWISSAVVTTVAHLFNLSLTQVWEVVTFYPLFNTEPIGKYCIQICTMMSCELRESTGLLKTCQRWLGIKSEETTVDTLFTLREVDCLGACSNAPVVRINKDYYENLRPEKMTEILQDLGEGKKPQAATKVEYKSSKSKILKDTSNASC